MTAGREYLGPYRLLRVILAGRTTTVWEAIRDSDSQRFALKILQGNFRKDREHINMLKQEYAVARNLDHPHVMHVYEMSISDDTPYLVMELFYSRNLKQEIRDGVERLAWQAGDIIQQAGGALAHMHEKGWVHRDVKPDNLLLDENGVVKLIDFAIAHRIKRGISQWLPFRSKVQGTRSYMSPEQIRGEPLDGRADIYSFGCTIHELLAGKPPYAGITSDDLLSKHLFAAVPSLVSVNENITTECAQLISQTLSKKREARPESMHRFLETMQRTRIFRTRPKPPGEVSDEAAK